MGYTSNIAHAVHDRSWRYTGPQLQVRESSGHYRTPTACARAQWALAELNSKRQIAAGTAGLQQQAPDRSEHYRTSTASARSQWALPDLYRQLHITVGTAGPQPSAPDRSEHRRTLPD